MGPCGRYILGLLKRPNTKSRWRALVAAFDGGIYSAPLMRLRLEEPHWMDPWCRPLEHRHGLEAARYKHLGWVNDAYLPGAFSAGLLATEGHRAARRNYLRSKRKKASTG